MKKYIVLAAFMLVSCRRAEPPATPAAKTSAPTSVVTPAKARAAATSAVEVVRLPPRKVGWISGVLTNVNGETISSARLWCVSAEGDQEKYFSADIAVASNGQYVAGPIKQGVYTFCLKTQWHMLSREPDAVRNGETNEVAFTIEPLYVEVPVVTGVVVDAESKEPLGDVRVVARLQREDKPPNVASWTDMTPGDGLFRLCPSNEMGMVSFLKAGYTPVHLDVDRIAENNGTVILARTAHVRVHVRDDMKMPASNVVVNCPHMSMTVRDGVAILSNVPVTAAPLTLDVLHHGHVLASNVVERLVAGETTDTTIFLPPLGRLVVRMDDMAYTNKFGSSIRVVGDAGTGSMQRTHLWANDFDRQPDGCFVRGYLRPGEYRIKVEGDDVVNLKTNLAVAANQDTELALRVGSNSVGTIWGVADNGTRFAPICRSTVFFAGTSQEVRRAMQMVSTNGFKISGLDAREVYDLQVNAQMWMASTSIVVRNVRPNGEKVRIMLDRAYEVRGTVVDERGNPLECKVRLWFEEHKAADGKFACGPLTPGAFILGVHAEGYAPYVRDLEIVGSDMDVGTIVMQRGSVVKGTLLWSDGSQCSEQDFALLRMPIQISPGLENTFVPGRTDDNGRFIVSNVPHEATYRMMCSQRDQVLGKDVKVGRGDYSLGDVRLRNKSYLEVTVLDPGGAPAKGIKTVAGLDDGDHSAGVWSGKEPETVPFIGELIMIPDIPEPSDHDGGMPDMSEINRVMQRIARVPCPQPDSPTNRMILKLTKQQWDSLKGN